MNYYALLYELVDDMVTRRVPFREEHLRLARESRERGELILAGALAEPVDRALLVFQVDDKSKVESFALSSAASPAISALPFALGVLKAKSKSSSKPPGARSNPSAASPVRT